MAWTIEALLNLIETHGASDVVFIPGTPPVIWRAGRMSRLDTRSLEPDDVEKMFLPMLRPGQLEILQERSDLDFSIGKQTLGRFRVNLHRQRGTLCAAVRFVPHEIPSFESLNLPERVLGFADLPRGLVLVTGGAGTGKSTTLAAMIEYINNRYAYHVITLEDPIEFVFQHKKSVIEQREIGVDSPSFAMAMRHVVRQRPDVILIGEMRDQETISAALTAAETGHLVLASLHTNNAVETVNRIIDVFPAQQQTQVRVQVSDTLQGVVCQILLHGNEPTLMMPAVEIMVCTEAIRRGIRDRETHLLRGMIETGRALGMQTMDSAIANLVTKGLVTSGEAIARAHQPDRMAKMIA